MATVCSWSTTASHLLHRVRAAPSLCTYAYKWKPWWDPCSRTQTAVCLCSSTNTDAELGSLFMEQETSFQKRRARRLKEGPKAMKFRFGSSLELTLEEIRKLAAANAATDGLLEPTTDEPTGNKAEDEGRASVPVSLPSMMKPTAADEPISDKAEDEGEVFSLLEMKRKLYEPAPETTQLAAYLKAQHNLTREEQDSYAKSKPSVIGTTIHDIQERVKIFRAVGFIGSEIDFLLPKFPFMMNFDHRALRNVYRVYRKLQKLGSPLWVNALLKRHKYIFLRDSKKIGEGLAVLAKMGLTRRSIASLLMKEPLLLLYPPTEEIRETIASISAAGVGSQWISRALYSNLRLHPARLELGPDVKEVVRMVKEELGLDPTYLILLFPQVFQVEAKQLESIVQTLRGKPLYLDMRDLKYLFSRVPLTIPHLADMESVSEHVEEYCSAFLSPKRAVYALRLAPRSLMFESGDVQKKVEFLREMGFTDRDRDELFSTARSLPQKNTERDFKPRIRLFLDVFNVTPSTLIEAGFARTLKCNVKVMQARCKYVKKYNNYFVIENGKEVSESIFCEIGYQEKLLDITRIDDIFLSSDMRLAELCNQTLEHYHGEMGCFAYPSYSKKSGSSKSKVPFDGITWFLPRLFPCRGFAHLSGKAFAVDAPTGKARILGRTIGDDILISELKDAGSKKKTASKSKPSGFKLQPEPAPTLLREGITEDGAQPAPAKTELKKAGRKKKAASKSKPSGFKKQPELAPTLSREGITEDGAQPAPTKTELKKAGRKKKAASKSKPSGFKKQPEEHITKEGADLLGSEEWFDQEPALTLSREDISEEGADLFDSEDGDEWSDPEDDIIPDSIRGI